MLEHITAPVPTAAPVQLRAGRGAALGFVAAAVPETTVANAPIAERLGIDERWIVERTGVLERRVARPDERLTTLAAAAGQATLERAGLDPLALGLVLVATTTPDHLIPNAAPVVAGELGAEAAAALDVGASCSGFLAAVALASGQIEAGRAQAALVIGADLLTRYVDPGDRRTAPLFGDGAGSLLMIPAEPGRVGPAILRADGSRADLIQAPGRSGWLEIQGHDTFKHAVARLSEVTRQAVAAAGIALEDVDLFVYHQANGRIIRAVGQRLALPGERVVDCIERYGNTSAASIPIALAEAEADGRLRDGARVLVAAFGAGLTWGGTVVEWGGSRGGELDS